MIALKSTSPVNSSASDSISADGSVQQWNLTVRKCFCQNADCQQRIFSERLVEFVKPWSRKTNRLIEQLTAIGLALAGAAGARLTPHLNLIASRETLLRFVRRLSPPSFAMPKVLGDVVQLVTAGNQ